MNLTDWDELNSIDLSLGLISLSDLLSTCAEWPWPKFWRTDWLENLLCYCMTLFEWAVIRLLFRETRSLYIIKKIGWNCGISSSYIQNFLQKFKISIIWKCVINRVKNCKRTWSFKNSLYGNCLTLDTMGLMDAHIFKDSDSKVR